MMCENPFMVGVLPAGCGKCFFCLKARKKLWTHRIMLESLLHAHSAFVTLTYNDEHLPVDGSLVPEHLQLFMKRLRKNYPCKLRFYGVGEYGDNSGRPHYHLALFGYNPADDSAIQRAWVRDGKAIGFVQVGQLSIGSAAYVAGYVTKKINGDDYLRGRHKEFCRMSNRPGLGAEAMQQVAEALQGKAGWDSINATGDVPFVLKHGATSYPLGRYLRQKLRKEMNFVDEKTPAEAIQKASDEMRAMYEDFVSDPANAHHTVRSMILQKSIQRRRNARARGEIFKQGKTF